MTDARKLSDDEKHEKPSANVDKRQMAMLRQCATWAGWGFQLQCGVSPHIRIGRGDWTYWNPCKFHDDAQLLIEKCRERGLMLAVAYAVMQQRDIVSCNGNEGTIQGLLATPTQKTLAVWQVVKELLEHEEGLSDGP